MMLATSSRTRERARTWARRARVQRLNPRRVRSVVEQPVLDSRSDGIARDFRGRIALAIASMLLGACTTLIGIEDFEGPVVPGTDGGTSSGTVSGVVLLENGDAPLPAIPGATVTLHGANGAVIESTLANASGNYAFGSTPDVLGFVQASTATTVFAPRRFLDNMTGQVTLTAFSDARLAGIAEFAATTQQLTSSCVFVDVIDQNGAAVPFAIVDSNGVGVLRYQDDALGLPSTMLTSTGASGAAWLFGVPAGPLRLSIFLVGGGGIQRTIEIANGTFNQLRVRLP